MTKTSTTDQSIKHAVVEVSDRKAVTRIKFQRAQDERWEYGIAVTSAPGLSDVQMIFPDDGTTPVDVLGEVWVYRLLPHSGSFVFPPGSEN